MKDWDYFIRRGVKRGGEPKISYCQYCGAKTGYGNKPGRPCPNCGSTTGNPSHTILQEIERKQKEI